MAPSILMDIVECEKEDEDSDEGEPWIEPDHTEQQSYADRQS